MLVAFRPAEATDVPVLVELYDRAYHGGYSACFDRYGPIGLQEFWWVQAEKSVFLLEVNHKAVGMLILGETGGRLLVEELLGESVGGTHGVASLADADEVLLRRIHEFLVHQFRRQRQDWMTLRSSETNPLALALARRFDFTFANALVVRAATAIVRPTTLPAGYTIRRATSEDARELGELHQDCFHAPLHPDDLRAALRRTQARAFLAECERYAVGFGIVEAKDGIGQGLVGVRETHRRKGVGTALTLEALHFAYDKGLVAVGTHWALDSAAGALCHRLKFTTERTYLYFEKRL